MPWAEDLTPFLRDFGVDVRHGGATVKGVLDAPTSAALGALVALDDYQLTLAADALPTLGHGDAITIARKEYVVREVWMLDDGAFKRATLRLV